MSYTLNLEKDDLAWDFVSTVAYESTVRGYAPGTATIERAKRRAISQREQIASGGAYTGSDVNWHLPARFVPTSITPKPGDVVVEEDDSRWTALEVAFNRVRQTWKLTCRNLAISAQLGDHVDIERATIEYDAAGVAVKQFPSGSAPLGGRLLYADLLCRVQPDTEEIAEQRGVRGQLERFRVIVSKQLYDLNPAEDRMKWTDRSVVKYLDIVSYQEAERIETLPYLIAEWRP